MRKKGLEPPRRAAPDPKSGAATNYATSAVRIFVSHKDRNESDICQAFLSVFFIICRNPLYYNAVIFRIFCVEPVFSPNGSSSEVMSAWPSTVGAVMSMGF